MNLLLEYIKYRWNGKGRHGVHSPFVYELIDKGFTAQLDSDFKEEIRSVRRQLKKDHRIIEVNDAGTGSKVLGKHRKVSQIYSVSASKERKSRLLYQLVKHFHPENILELGTSLGVGTMSLCSGYEASHVISIDACKATQDVAIQLFKDRKKENVTFIHQKFDHFMDEYRGKQFDLVFVDGHHSGEALLHYMDRLETMTHQDTIFILDDIRWSEDMQIAFRKIVNDPDYHVTLDLFDIGIVAKRPQQEKEHFVLKY